MSTVFTDGTTPLDAAHMNALQQKVEKGLANGYVGLDASGNVALASAAKVVWAGDTNIYRQSAGVVASDGTFLALPAADSTYGYATRGSTDTIVKWGVTRDGHMYWGAGGSTTVDTVLYRNNPDSLKTDDNFVAALDIYPRAGGAAQMQIGSCVGGAPGMYFGQAADTNLYRQSANALGTDGYLYVKVNTTTVQTGLLLNILGTMKQLEVGAPDSGGAGYRMA